MGELLRQFYELWKASQREADRPVYARAPSEIIQAMSGLGMSLERPEASSRLEFLSPKREAWSGAWIQSLPAQMPGEAVQRVFAAVFQGLPKGAPFVLMHEQPDSTGLKAWLRQAGFEALLEGSSPGSKVILSKRI